MKRRALIAGLGLAAASVPLAGCQSLQTSRALALGTPVAEPRPQQPGSISGKLLFVKNGDIWIYADGRQRQLTSGARYEGAAWSPDGASIAASTLGENHSDLVVLTAAGARVRQLTRNLSNVSIANQAWARKPAWSPSGNNIAFVTDTGYVDMSLSMIPSVGGTARRLVVHQVGGGGVDWPTWQPDGSHVSYVDFSEHQSRISVYSLDTTAYKAITDFAEGALDPAWSPDGQWIAFAAREAKRSDIYVMATDGSTVTRLTDTGGNRAPCWSPDGSMLAFITTSNGAFDIAVVRVALASGISSSTPRQLTNGERIDGPSGLSWTA